MYLVAIKKCHQLLKQLPKKNTQVFLKIPFLNYMPQLFFWIQYYSCRIREVKQITWPFCHSVLRIYIRVIVFLLFSFYYRGSTASSAKVSCDFSCFGASWSLSCCVSEYRFLSGPRMCHNREHHAWGILPEMFYWSPEQAAPWSQKNGRQSSQTIRGQHTNATHSSQCNLVPVFPDSLYDSMKDSAKYCLLLNLRVYCRGFWKMM